MTQVSESDYRTAQEGNAKVRQEFLDAVDLEEAGEFIFTTLYRHSNIPSESYIRDKRCESNILMVTILPAIKLFGIKFPFSRESGIGVFKDAFNLSFPSFLGTLIDHEGQHARVNYRRPLSHTTLDLRIKRAKSPEEREYFGALNELPAYANELANAKRRGLSHEEIIIADKLVNLYFGKLVDYSSSFKKPRTPWKDVEEVLCDSPGDNLLRRILNLNGKNESLQEILREVEG